MKLFAHTPGGSPARQSLKRRLAVNVLLLSALWIAGRTGVTAQTLANPPRPNPAPPIVAPSGQSPQNQASQNRPSQGQPPAPRTPATQKPDADASADAAQPADEPTPLMEAARALREGRYERVEEIAERARSAPQPATAQTPATPTPTTPTPTTQTPAAQTPAAPPPGQAKPGQPAPPVASPAATASAFEALRAKAAIARGRYDAALTILTAASAAAPGQEATLQLGVLQHYLGKRTEAAEAFTQVIRSFTPEARGADLARIARAARALGQPRQAMALYQRAANVAAQDPTVQTGWGELFLEKFNTAEAVDAFRTALKADPRWTDAYLGLARALIDESPDRAADAAKQALAINKSSVEARLILAELALDERKLDEARKEVERAQETNPQSLEAMALLAGIANLQGRKADFDTQVQRALAINPKYGDIYRVPGTQAASHYRFEEAAGLTRKALEVDPENPRALADLGMQLLRTGDEAGARTVLDRAFKLDAYDVVTYNLLQMLDTLDKFETFREGDLIVRLHPEDAKVLKEPLIRLARESLDALSKQYGFTPKGPILIEAFPKHDDFAVRTLGLPGMIGALGACFGTVVTLDSPRAARTPGSFNWAATLWHELAHVITLQMSSQRVPRWLTEGASVFEERRARPEWGREGEFEFLTAMARGELIEVADLNSGFMSARTITLAYHESSLLVEHLVETFGDPKLQAMLKAYGEGVDTEVVFRRVLDTDVDAIQKSFDQFLDRRFAKAAAALKPIGGEPAPAEEGAARASAGEGGAKPPEPAGPALPPDADPAAVKAFADRYDRNYPVQVRAGRVLLEKGDLEGAQAVLERAVTLVPQTMGDASARMGLAEVATKRGDSARAIRELEALLKESHTGLDAARKLAALARETKDEPVERRAIERMVALDPFDPTIYAGLGRLALTQQDAPAALRALQTALDLGPQDPAAVHTDLAEAYLLSGDTAQVKQHAILALEIAPRFERAQELLLKVVDARRP